MDECLGTVPFSTHLHQRFFFISSSSRLKWEELLNFLVILIPHRNENVGSFHSRFCGGTGGDIKDTQDDRSDRHQYNLEEEDETHSNQSELDGDREMNEAGRWRWIREAESRLFHHGIRWGSYFPSRRPGPQSTCTGMTIEIPLVEESQCLK